MLARKRALALSLFHHPRVPSIGMQDHVENLLQIGTRQRWECRYTRRECRKGGKQTCHAIHFIEHDRDKARRAPYACGLCRADA